MAIVEKTKGYILQEYQDARKGTGANISFEHFIVGYLSAVMTIAKSAKFGVPIEQSAQAIITTIAVMAEQRMDELEQKASKK